MGFFSDLKFGYEKTLIDPLFWSSIVLGLKVISTALLTPFSVTVPDAPTTSYEAAMLISAISIIAGANCIAGLVSVCSSTSLRHPPSLYWTYSSCMSTAL